MKNNDLCKSKNKGKLNVIVKKVKPHWSCVKKYTLDKER